MKRLLTIALVILAVLAIWSVASTDATTTEKIKICHQTHSVSNPSVTIEIFPSALSAHLAHGDTQGQCPPSVPPVQEPEEPETPVKPEDKTPVQETEKPQPTVPQPVADKKAVETSAPYTDLPQFSGK